MTLPWDHAAAARRFDEAELADQRFRADQGALVRYYDKFLTEVGEEGAYSAVQFNRPRRLAGGLSISIPRADMVHFDHFFANADGEDAVIPITVNTAAYRWDGYCTRALLVRDEEGVETVEIEAISCKQHVATTALWASPFAPILAQYPRHDIKFGGIESLFLLYMTTNLIRLQAGFWRIANRWIDAPDWVQVGNALWPITVVPIDLMRDSSPWRAFSARFDMGEDLIPLMDDTGVMVDAGFYLPGEDEQPAPEWFVLDRPTVVLRTRNKSGSRGPTGTLLDGLISFFEEFVDDTTLKRTPNFHSQSEYEAVYATTGPFGTVRNLPWVWYREGEYSGIGRSEVAIHKPLATSVIVGGRSPGWVNAAIEIAMKNLLAWLGLLIGIPGLDSLYQGQLDDVFLAWAVYEDAGRIQRAGPFAQREHVVTNSSKAFTLDGVMAGLDGLDKTKGYTSKRVTVGDGGPYIPGRDYETGDMIGFELGDWALIDYVEDMIFTDDPDRGARWELEIGDGSDEEDSTVKQWKRMQQFAQAFKTLFTDVGADLDLIIF
ncbi:phage tail protein [Nocardia puris]|uniref:Gp37-like protein n=1 Tax=Nocardia puris TaxID=208602 RepID=UPI001892E650|nr:phage tail protein [Nocardia puris]MBF6459798.1 phage tail protein [Nocardia puris]